VVDAAIAWLRDRKGKFFLWVHLYEPHAPYEPPPPFREKFPDDPYAGEVAAADAQVGRLLEELQRLGLAPSTAVAVLGDHGEALGNHGESTHGLLLYEPTTRVPLVLRAPGLLPAGQVVATPVSTVDLAPTLARLAGASVHDRFARDGRDLSPWLKKREEPPGRTLFAETLYPGSFGWAGLFAVRQGKWKYVAAPSPELFDLEADPGETTNLWTTKASQATPLREALLAHLSETATSQNVTLDTEARRQLSSLGYVAPASPTPQSAADPKAMVGVFAAFEKAHALRLAGQTQRSAELLRQALEKDPRNPVLLAELAETSRALGEARTAVALYQRVLEINPADREARYNLALALREAGEEEQAFQALEAAIRLDPGRPELHEALGVVLAARGEFAKAREAFERSCQLDPHNPRSWNNLGNALREQGRLEEAEAAFRRALDEDPGYAEAWNGLGVVQVEKGQTEAAVASFQQALRLAPENLEVRLNLAIAWDEAGEREKARRAYQEFLAAARGKPGFREQLALARKLLGRLEHVQADERR